MNISLSTSKYFINKHIPILEVKNKNSVFASNKYIVFYHSLAGSKETYIEEIKVLASNSFTVLAVDNVGHGERKYFDSGYRFSDSNPDYQKNIEKAIIDTALETPNIIDFILNKKKSIQPIKIGIMGISMGAFITYKALELENRISTAVTILGSPEWNFEILINKLDKYVQAMGKVKLLSQNATLDKLVSPDGSKHLHDLLKIKYKNKYFDNFKYIEYSNSGHFMQEKDWIECLENSYNWFNKKLI